MPSIVRIAIDNHDDVDDDDECKGLCSPGYFTCPINWLFV